MNLFHISVNLLTIRAILKFLITFYSSTEFNNINDVGYVYCYL